MADERWKGAVADLYEEFSTYPLRPNTEPCPCCHTPEDEARVHRKPLRELSPEDLQSFAGDSLMTWGELEDFKHFLPRLIEILGEDGFPDDYPDAETVFGGLGRGDWRSWPEREQVVIASALTELWLRTLRDWQGLHEAETVLSALSEVYEDMNPLLQAWAKHEGDDAAMHFATFLWRNANQALLGKRLSNPWLSQNHEQERQVREWLPRGAKSFLSRMEAIFAEATDERTVEVLIQTIPLAEALAGRSEA